MLIDTHAHLAHGKLRPQVEAVLARAQEAGVSRVICAAADLRETEAALEFSARFEGVYGTAGVHPHEAKEAPNNYLARLEAILAKPKCVAVGEIGLDYHYDFSPRNEQRRVFAEQLGLARRLDAPIVVHTREAFDDTMAILAESGAAGQRVVFHSFTGDPAEARRALDFGATLSFSGIATFASAEEIRAAVRLAPAERIFVETDAPFLSPEPVRSMRINEPANVVHTARRLAELRGEAFEAFAEQTTQNAVRFFQLS